MKRSDKNIIMITAGGTGQRFQNVTPKQFCLLGGNSVISYVINACKKSCKADAVLVVADPIYHEELQKVFGVDVADSGPLLNQTKRNGFDYIRAHSSCKKLIVADAVRPFITAEILDRIFDALDIYDAVACARKITDSMGCYHSWTCNREDYYTLNAPEGFRFPLLDQYFRADSDLTESIQQLPDTSTIHLIFDVPYFEKITYPEDILRAEAILKYRELTNPDIKSACSARTEIDME